MSHASYPFHSDSKHPGFIDRNVIGKRLSLTLVRRYLYKNGDSSEGVVGRRKRISLRRPCPQWAEEELALDAAVIYVKTLSSSPSPLIGSPGESSTEACHFASNRVVHRPSSSSTHLRHSPPPSKSLGWVENWTPYVGILGFAADYVCLGRLRV